ncbi:MAG TPA: C40 family peptidase [Saprospiraceae bacterium]|nr:C40 family peptidase [Saprospiraceae bacterium]
MFELKNHQLIYFLFVVVSLGFVSCSTSKQVKYEKGNSEYTYKRIKKGTYESSSDLEFLEVNTASSVKNYAYNNKEKPKTEIKYNTSYKPSKKTRNTAQDTEEEILREEVYEVASQYLGISYRSGGKAPNTGFDCSGFTNYVFQTLSLPVSGTSVSLSRLGELRKNEELKRGDLVFFGKNGNIHHVGIVSSNINGEIEMIHSSSSAGITTDIIQRSDYWRKRFMYGKDVITGFLEQKNRQNNN